MIQIRTHSLFKKLSLILGAMALAVLASMPAHAGGSGKVPPTVTNPTFADVTATTATLGGEVTSQGSSPISDRGVEWGTASAPAGQHLNSVSEGGTTTGVFTVPVTGLPAGTLIYFRAWAVNSDNRTGYTAETTFTTNSAAQPPTLDLSTLSALSDVTANSATLGGRISADGGDTVTQHGTAWNTTGGTITENASLEGPAGAIPYTFSSLRSGFPSGTQIHFRSYATNINDTSYGPDNSFHTEPANSPAAAPIDNVGDVSFRISWPANPGGDGDGALVVVSTNTITATPTDGVEHAFNSVYGTGGTDIGTAEYVVYRGTGATNVTVTGLSDTTTYNVAVFYSTGAGSGETGINYRQNTPATNSQQTNTPAVAPTVTVATPGSITTTSAVLGGEVTADGGAAVTERGIVWNTTSPAESGGTVVPIGSGVGTFSQTVGGMPSGTLIYVKAYATNSAGTSYSAVEESFTTLIAKPTVDAPTVTGITATSATLGGRVFLDGGGTVSDRGTVWGTSPNPTGNALSEGSGTGTFSHERTGLPTGVTVYFRAYATNEAGTSYSEDSSFIPSSPPVLGAPTVANITHFSADLGGIITSDGGNPILQRGTVWNTTGSPVVENALDEGGTAVSEAFSHTRFLPAGTTIFYRAYATTVVGTGYSAEDSFTTGTEPTIQASNVTFPRVASASLKIRWVRGNGDGVAVVLRLSTDSRVDPSDTIDYTANPDFNLAPLTGAGNRVVYKGSATAVNVIGLSQNTSYSVAVYEYAGTGGSTDYLQLNPAEGSQSTNDTPVHNMDWNADCTDCHSHGSFLSHGAEQKAVCETCHNDLGTAAAKLEFDLHLTPNRNPALDYVDCGFCHELHNPSATNTTLSQHPVTLLTQHNKSFLRANVDKYVANAATPAVLHTDTPKREDPHPDAPQAADNPDRAIEGGNDTTARGYCQVCHTLTNYHRSSNTAGADQCHDGESGNCGPAETHCGDCHQHNNKFIGVGGSQTCIQCHASGLGDRPIIITQFDLLSSHIQGGSSVTTEPDCLVCHDQGGHTGGTVSTWDADDGVTSYTQPNLAGDPPPINPTISTGEGEAFAPHCMSCHEDGLASYLPTGGSDQTQSSPFTGSGSAPVISQSAWNNAGHNRPVATSGSSPVTCLGDGTNGCHGSAHGSEQLSLLAPASGATVSPTDFCYVCHDSDGPSVHNIQAEFNTTTNYQATSGAGLLANQRHDITAADQAYSGGAVSCKDCHSVHVDNATDPVADPDDASPLATYSPTGSYTDDGYNWSYDGGGNQDPVNPAGAVGGPYTQPDYIQFCLTCHDGNTTNQPGVTMSPNMVNMAASGNGGGYPEDHHGPIEANSGSKVGKGSMKQPWATAAEDAAGEDPATPYAAMNCNQCHGPHGSPNIYNLLESITIGGVQMTVGGQGNLNEGHYNGSTTYTLPLIGGTQADHYWGAWCTFCHKMEGHPGKVETDACTTGHKHGGGAF